EEDVTRESRFNFSGYGMGHCLQVKDGTAVKATPANQLPQPPKDADAIKKKFVDRAKRIDTISRAAFPLAFLIFNIFYWITYKIIRHEDVHKKQIGYGMGHCLQVKDGTAVKATPANQLPQPPKDADAIKKKFVDRAKRIDTISRAAFPLAFLIFNIFYWITYKIIRHEDVHKKQMCPSDPRTSCLTLALVNTQ
ncbi:Glycine receptor subunit alpha-2, partial [Camelus dromedarius]